MQRSLYGGIFVFAAEEYGEAMRYLFMILVSLWLTACATAPQSTRGEPEMVDAPPTTEDCPLGQQMVCRASSRENIRTGEGRFCRCEINRSIH